jgi:hypothetical protein
MWLQSKIGYMYGKVKMFLNIFLYVFTYRHANFTAHTGAICCYTFLCGHNTAGSTPGNLLLSPYVLSCFYLFCTLKGFYTWEQVMGCKRSEEQGGCGGNDTFTPQAGVLCRSFIGEHDAVGVF